MKRVHHGRGAVHELPGELDILGARRVVLVTSPSVRRHPQLGVRIEAMLGDRLVGVFDGVRPHVPYACLDQGLDLVRSARPDVLLSLGAGSVVDAARALALAAGEGLAEAAELERFRAVFHPPAPPDIPGTSGRSLPVIAIPTTLSAAEFANCAAVTSEARGTKDLLIADELTPSVVLLDPDLGVTTPTALWSSTGMRALDHAIETVYSPRSGPITDALSLDAIRRLGPALRATVRDPGDVAAREAAQVAAWASYFGEMNLTLGLSHAIGHQVGARHGVQHGWTSCVLLPSVMRWLAPATADKQARIAAALGVDTSNLTAAHAAERAAEAVEQLVLDLELPTSLRDIGVTHVHFDGLAEAVLQDLVVAGSPRPVTHDDVVTILQAAH
jgi:alcohol dehydrogenase